MRWVWGRWVAVALAVTTFACGGLWNTRPSAVPHGAATGYDVLLVTLDTTRADHLGCYGARDAATPVLDGIAARGLRVTQAFTVAPVTLPAHASILTGLEPPTHGVRNNGEFRLADAHMTLAEVLAERGYDTAAFVSSFVLDRRFGLGQGFAHYDDHLTALEGPFPAGNPERSGAEVTDAALAWLTTRSPEQRLLWWVHYYDAHAPYLPPARVAGHTAYADEIAAVDTQVGRLLDGLTKAGRRERTIVIVVADHGESLGEHGEATHSVFVYDAVAHVPLLIEAPGVVRGPALVDDAVVSTTDIVPTVLGMLGVTDAVRRDGQDMLAGHRDPARAVWTESLVPYLDYGWAPLWALRRRSDKFILAPRNEYYDLGHDPAEMVNRLDDPTDPLATNRAALEAALTERLARQPSLEAIGAVSHPVDRETATRLAALGYVEGPAPDPAGALADPKDMVWIVDALIRGNAALAAGRIPEALAAVAEAAVAQPRDRSVLYLMGEVYLRMNYLPEAEAAYRAVQAIRPKADAALLLGQIALLDGRIDEATARLDEAERLDPHHGGVAIARGDLLVASGRLADAEASYRHAEIIDPSRAAGIAIRRRRQLPER